MISADPIAVVSISGGKDSNATALVAIQQYGRERVRLVHADTGNEHPETQRYVRDYLPGALGLPVEIVKADFTKQIARKRTYIKRNWEYMGVPLERIDRALDVLHPTGNPFLDLCMWKGRFPSRKAQFCTAELKSLPLDKYMVALCKSGLTVESWQGVRRNESLARANALKWERSDWGWMIHRPIVDWTAAMTFEMMERHYVDPNPLYRQGMNRVGCMPCINCGKDELHEIDARWPAEIDRIDGWEALVSDASKRGTSTLFRGHPIFDGETDHQIAARVNIRRQVEWAATSRGGKQYDLERAIPSPECSSVYGLCE